MYTLAIPIIIIILLLLFTIFFHCRKKHIIKKIRCMDCHEKTAVINDIAGPFGYVYNICQDIFGTRIDAPQKKFGFCDKYDRVAPYLNMIYDYLPVYFDYNGKTWLIELWKGQYGINTGCETGVYHASCIIPPSKYKDTLFQAVSEDEMLMISSKLFRKENLIAQASQKHWWLTMFRPGIFSLPKNLIMHSDIGFPDCKMAAAFADALTEICSGTNNHDRGNGEWIKISREHSHVFIIYKGGNNRFSFPKKIVRCFSLAQNKIFCGLFNFLTRDFRLSGDKLLYVYYYLPAVIRKIMCSHIFTGYRS